MLTDYEQLSKAKFGGLVGVNGDPRAAVHFWSPETTTQNMAEEESVMDDDLRELTGVTHYNVGGVVPGMQKTAAGVSTLTAEGNVKQEDLIQMVAETSVLPLVDWAVEGALLWVGDEEVTRIIGASEKPPTWREVLGKDFTVEIEAGAPVVSRQIENQELEYLIQVMAGVGNLFPDVVGSATVMALITIFKNMGKPELAAQFEQLIPKAPQGTTPPAGQGMEGLPNPQFQRQMIEQGRTPTRQER